MLKPNLTSYMTEINNYFIKLFISKGECRIFKKTLKEKAIYIVQIGGKYEDSSS